MDIALSRATVALSSKMTPKILVDMVNTTIFKESEWIGANKEYHNVPTHVSDAKSNRLSVPQSYEGSFPSPDLPVIDFLALRLPRVSSGIITTKLQLWFSTSEPTTNPDCLFTRAIPSPQFLKRLEEAFGQAWFDGAKSIVDPRFNKSRDRLPLWTLGFWPGFVQRVGGRMRNPLKQSGRRLFVGSTKFWERSRMMSPLDQGMNARHVGLKQQRVASQLIERPQEIQQTRLQQRRQTQPKFVLSSAAERRYKIFREFKIPRLDSVSTARVTAHCPLKSGDYVLVMVGDDLMVGEGQCLLFRGFYVSDIVLICES